MKISKQIFLSIACLMISNAMWSAKEIEESIKPSPNVMQTIAKELKAVKLKSGLYKYNGKTYGEDQLYEIWIDQQVRNHQGPVIMHQGPYRTGEPRKPNPKITSKTVTIELGKGVTAVNAHIEPTNQDVSLSSDHPSKNITIPSSHSFEFQRRECHVFAPPAIGTECSSKKDNMIQNTEDLTLQFFTKKNHKNEEIVAYFSYKQLSSKKNKIVINANNVTLNGKTLRISK